MVDKAFRVPLSPPNSPRMSDFAKTAEKQSQRAGKSHAQSGYRSHQDHSDLRTHRDVSAYSQDPSKSCLSTYNKSFAYSTAPTDGSYEPYTTDGFSSNASSYSQQPRHPDSPELQSTTSYGGSLATCPDGRLTPRSPDTSVQEQQEDDELIDSAGDDQDEGPEKVEMTAAELRAHKRKMKRFRLTHSQTRFLMSEFARQAHPDAGHRERLAREIPGLSARQVQVWFQNRRAKLKRHTTDDQARMMRSRAMPEDFDTTQALHSPFGPQQPHMGVSFPSMGTYPAYSEQGVVRPLTLDAARGVSGYDHYAQPYASSTGLSPALGAFAFTPPHSVPNHISPIPSTTMSPYLVQHQSTYPDSRRGPIGLPAFDHGQAPIHHTQRLTLHDRANRPYGESTTSSLRTSTSHSGLGGPHHPLPERASSFSDHTSYSHQHTQPSRVVSVTESETYGNGYQYDSPQSYPSNGASQQQSTAVDHTTESDQVRRAPSALAYGQYPPTSYTSAPYQNYPPYASREAHSNYVHTPTSEPPERMNDGRSMRPSY